MKKNGKRARANDKKKRAGRSPRPKNFFVYIVRCRNGSLYTGTAKDVAQRVRAHNAGRGARYTRAFGPVTLEWSAPSPTRSAACQTEARLKKLSRQEKLEWIRKN